MCVRNFPRNLIVGLGNRFTFAEVIIKNPVYCFLRHSVYFTTFLGMIRPLMAGLLHIDCESALA